ncbi:collagenase-like [Uranotaenia lowii]|uniref:collagenase-like n=1 Tax=Uranotaenia lowii TaxID=190385 RepID=UPI002479D2B0|nr:collagenase-like [Uranotaenia lowii]
MSRNPFVHWLVWLVSIIVGTIRAEDDPRIVNGQNAQYGQFPYQAMLTITNPDRTSRCGGSLISERWILTAAHCIDEALVVEILLGTIYRNPTDDGSLRLVSTLLIVHPKFNPDTLENDIGLIHLLESVEFTDRIAPIQLPSGHQTYQGRAAIASGFGRTKTDGSPAERLQYAVMDVLSNAMCASAYPGIIRSTNICAVGRNRSSTCNGDSGGPLRLENENVLIGVTSFGSSMAGCEMNYPVGFTRVSEYIEFILLITGDLG